MTVDRTDLKEDLDRGLERWECELLVRAPRQALRVGMSPYRTRKLLRDELIIRMLYETSARVSELCRANIEDIHFETRVLMVKHPVGEYNRRTGGTTRDHRATFFSEDTKDLLLRYLEGRLRGPIFLNKRGRRVNARLCERVVDHYARVLDIQRIVKQSKRGRVYKKPRYLITCEALRERAERIPTLEC